jgi:hypothetical protein
MILGVGWMIFKIIRRNYKKGLLRWKAAAPFAFSTLYAKLLIVKGL